MNARIMMGICGIVWGLSATLAGAAPHARSSSSEWQLDLKFHDPQRISIRLPGDRGETVYWYVLYTATNNTKRDRGFYPSFRLVTDTFDVVEGGAQINPRIHDAIVDRHKGEFPFLLPPTKTLGLLLQGEANERTSFVVFRDFDKRASSFSVFTSGLSGEIDRRSNPTFDASKPESKTNVRQFILRRTLEVQYDFPGDPRTRDRTIPVRRNRRWVMR